MRIWHRGRRSAAVVALSLLISSGGSADAVRPTQEQPSPYLERYRAAFLADREPSRFTRPIGPIPCRDGFAGPFPCKKVDLLSFIPLSEMGGVTGNDIWGWTDPATGKEYAIMGLSNGTAFVDISDPDDPVFLGQLPTPTIPSIWRDVKVYKNHAFIVADAAFDHGLSIFDLRELRDPLVTPRVFPETTFYDEFGSAHNVAINEASGYAYVVGSDECRGGLHMVDIGKPRQPKFAGCFKKDGYTHDVQCVIYRGPDRRYRGREICFASNEDTLTIVDVTKKKRPVLLSRTGYPGVGYTHQGWLYRGQSRFALDDELDEQERGHNTRTRYFDVSDLDDPKLIAVYDGPTRAIDHNLFVKKGLIYEANYRAGLRIVRPLRKELGYFDVYPSDNLADFNGAWSVYPYFKSGVVVVSGIEQGLFVLRPKVG